MRGCTTSLIIQRGEKKQKFFLKKSPKVGGLLRPMAHLPPRPHITYRILFDIPSRAHYTMYDKNRKEGK